MTNNKELMRECQETMRLLASRWGVGTETPLGKIAVSSRHGTEFTTVFVPPEGAHNGIAVKSYGDHIWAAKDHGVYGASTDDLLALAESLAAMTQHFASKDFQRRLVGATELLERINKALRGPNVNPNP